MFDAVCPLDARYVGAEEATRKEVEPYLSVKAEIRYQLRVECAVLHAFAELGVLPGDDLAALDGLEDSITPEEVYAEEEKTQHNIRALVNCIQARLPDELKPFVHLGPTSADITDTGRALQLRDFTRNVLLPRLVELERLLSGLAREHAGTLQIGRTHGQHAVPTTFGHAVALFVSRLGNRMLALEKASDALVGKMAGAVGTYNSFALVHPPDPRAVERVVMKRLGLNTSPTGIASQIAEPEPLVDLACASISAFSVLANLADDFRHLMRTEIAEIGKVTSKGHVGSSTMPHKVNPKDFENIKSLWKAFMPRVLTLFADQISEHQRDLSNSASGRFLLELVAGFYYGVIRTIRIMKKTTVNVERMRANLETSKETFIAEPLYIVSGLCGIPNAYDIFKKLSETARERKCSLSDVVEADGWPGDIAARLDEASRSALDAIVKAPESYRGLAETVALETCTHWESVLDDLESRLAGHRSAP
jgi:adenylosuccinate lyase